MKSSYYLELDLFNIDSFPFDLPLQRYIHPHHYHHRHPLPLPPSEDFHDTAECILQAPSSSTTVRCLDRLATLEHGLDPARIPCFCTQEIKLKCTAKVKGPNGRGFDRMYKWTVELNGEALKSVRQDVEHQRKGMYAPFSGMCMLHAAFAAEEDIWGAGIMGNKVSGTTANAVKITDEHDRRVTARRQALSKKTLYKNKGKKKELSLQDAAMVIQRTFREHLSRRSRAVHCLRDLAVAKANLRELKACFSKFSYFDRLANDAEERRRFSEKTIALLFTVDAIECPDFMVRSAKRLMIQELEAMLEVVDPHPPRKLGSARRQKFDLLGGCSNEMLSTVADVVKMLEHNDYSDNILPNSLI